MCVTSSTRHGHADGTGLSGPRASEDATFARRHVGLHPASDGVVEGDGRLLGILNGVGEEPSLGDLDELLELRRRHLQVLAGDPLEVVGRVQLVLRLSDHAADRFAEPLERDGVEHEEWGVAPTYEKVEKIGQL